MTTKTDIVRDYYYKAKAQPSISRCVDGLSDPLAEAESEWGGRALRAVIDEARREPEDSLSMDYYGDTRQMNDIGRWKIDCYAHNRENMAYRAFKLVDSNQCRGET